MKFGTFPLTEAEGGLLAHAVVLADGRLSKGRRLGPAELARLRADGVDAVTVAMLAGGDMTENDAAAAIGRELIGEAIEAEPAATGRVNLFAKANGVLVVDRAKVDCMNEVDPSLTLATLPEYAPVAAGQMVATIKIIPLAVPGAVVESAVAALSGGAALQVLAYRPLRVALVQTTLPSLKASVRHKTRKALDSRLVASGSVIVDDRLCDHETRALVRTLNELGEADLVIVFGASAVIDTDDVVPAAIRLAGGKVRQLGMPVDPGNLLLLGRFRDRPIIGAPGCARSPKENGFDWVLNRLIAGIDVTPQDIRGLGVGGLLSEIPTRPQPRMPTGR